MTLLVVSGLFARALAYVNTLTENYNHVLMLNREHMGTRNPSDCRDSNQNKQVGENQSINNKYIPLMGVSQNRGLMGTPQIDALSLKISKKGRNHHMDVTIIGVWEAIPDRSQWTMYSSDTINTKNTPVANITIWRPHMFVKCRGSVHRNLRTVAQQLLCIRIWGFERFGFVKPLNSQYSVRTGLRMSRTLVVILATNLDQP